MCSNFMINVLLVSVDVFVDDENKKVNNMLFFLLFHSYHCLIFGRHFINIIASDDNLLIGEMNIIQFPPTLVAIRS